MFLILSHAEAINTVWNQCQMKRQYYCHICKHAVMTYKYLFGLSEFLKVIYSLYISVCLWEQVALSHENFSEFPPIFILCVTCLGGDPLQIWVVTVSHMTALYFKSGYKKEQFSHDQSISMRQFWKPHGTKNEVFTCLCGAQMVGLRLCSSDTVTCHVVWINLCNEK